MHPVSAIADYSDFFYGNCLCTASKNHLCHRAVCFRQYALWVSGGEWRRNRLPCRLPKLYGKRNCTHRRQSEKVCRQYFPWLPFSAYLYTRLSGSHAGRHHTAWAIRKIFTNCIKWNGTADKTDKQPANLKQLKYEGNALRQNGLWYQ